MSVFTLISISQKNAIRVENLDQAIEFSNLVEDP